MATLGLDAREVEWLAVLAACELTPRLTRVLGYLDDAVTPAPPTPATAAVLWDWPIGYQPGPASSLARWQLAAPLEDAWHSTSPWTIDADVAAYLAGREDWAEMRRAARLLDVGGLECLHPELLAQMRDAIAGVDGMGCEVELVGPPGSGRRTLLGQLAVELGRRPALVADGAGVRGLRTARLLDATPIWLGDDPVIGVDTTAGGLTLVARTTPARANAEGTVRLSWTMPTTHATQRRTLWGRLTDEPAPRIVEEWDLTPADVRAGAAAGGAASSRVIRDRLRVGTNDSMSPLGLPV